MFGFLKRKKQKAIESMEVIDLRKNKQSIMPAKGNIDPIHAILIGAAMQSGEAIFGNFDDKKLEIKD